MKYKENADKHGNKRWLAYLREKENKSKIITANLIKNKEKKKINKRKYTKTIDKMKE